MPARLMLLDASHQELTDLGIRLDSGAQSEVDIGRWFVTETELGEFVVEVLQVETLDWAVDVETRKVLDAVVIRARVAPAFDTGRIGRKLGALQAR
ncbi:hypothetical protein KC331_g19323, partial [Hortaea werneckii]